MVYPREKGDTETYSLLLAAHSGIMSILSEKFPDTLILPALGNNDSEFHDNPIPNNDSFFFYDYLYNLWFRFMPGNVNSLTDDQKSDIYDSFVKGGYYRVDLNDKLSVISMNTLFFDSERSLDLDASPQGYIELAWLRKQLEEDSDRKFILTSHVYAGARYASWALFLENANAAYFEILE